MIVKRKAKVTFKFEREPTTVTVEIDEDDFAHRHARMLHALHPNLVRDEQRQAGTQKSRGGSRMPRLDAWLDEKLAADGTASNQVLFDGLPGEKGDHLYRKRDGSVWEPTHQVSRKGFDKRVTEARKRVKRR